MSVGSIGAVGSSLQTSTDPRDLNHDGKVTAAEIQAYEQAHPDPKKVEAAAKPAGTEPGASATGEPRLLDLSV